MLPARPLLAYTVKDMATVKLPVLASPKLDGIRCLIGPQGPVSRSLKPIPNRHIRRTLNHETLRGLDGELMLRDLKATFRQITSAVMSEDGEPDFVFMVFDYFGQSVHHPYANRGVMAASKVEDFASTYVKLVHQSVLLDLPSIQAYEEKCVQDGYEGIMVRDPRGLYKEGRSTEREGILGKVKRFTDAEAICIGVEELFHNDNPATTNALGLTERSHHQAGKVPSGTMGALIVRGANGLSFSIGTGFTAMDRAALWTNPPIGKIVKYKAMQFSDYDLPRHPVFLGFRDPNDL